MSESSSGVTVRPRRATWLGRRSAAALAVAALAVTTAACASSAPNTAGSTASSGPATTSSPPPIEGQTGCLLADIATVMSIGSGMREYGMVAVSGRGIAVDRGRFLIVAAFDDGKPRTPPTALHLVYGLWSVDRIDGPTAGIRSFDDVAAAMSTWPVGDESITARQVEAARACSESAGSWERSGG